MYSCHRRAAGVDVILVGDSLGMVVMGRDTTVGVTLEEVRHHCIAVAAGASTPLIVGDLPFGSYITPDDAARNAAWMLSNAHVDVVKLEGGQRVVRQIEAIIGSGMAVMGHIGLTPQSYTQLGGFRCQGKSADAAMRLVEDAVALQDAGCFSIVLECIPSQLAAFVTEHLNVPTIGIGAGPHTSGQVMVAHDILGLSVGRPKFAREFEPVGALVEAAMGGYVSAVQEGSFPATEHMFNMSHRQWDAFAAMVTDDPGLPDPADFGPTHPRVAAAPTPTLTPTPTPPRATPTPTPAQLTPPPPSPPTPAFGMQVVESIDAVRVFRRRLDGDMRVGLVPTMGGLHQGHLDLIHAARQECDVVVVSLFVNPTQFAPGEDLATYPRQLEEDLATLRAAGVDAVFTPDVGEMYGANTATFVNLDGIDRKSEGARRPGFFRGVATVCTKLFNIVHPDTVFFGQKDALQCTVIRRIVADLNMPIEVRVCATAREEDGLAMSTRNVRLTEGQRAVAPVLYAALLAAKTAFEAAPDTATVVELGARACDVLLAEPMVGYVEYISIADPDTGEEVEAPYAGCVVSAAIRFREQPGIDGDAALRILDNIVL